MSGVPGMKQRSSARARNRRLREILHALPKTPDANALQMAQQLASIEVLTAEFSTRVHAGERLSAEDTRTLNNLVNTGLALRKQLNLAAQEVEDTQPRVQQANWLALCTDEEVEWLRDLLLRTEQRRKLGEDPSHPVVNSETGGGRNAGSPPVTFSKVPRREK